MKNLNQLIKKANLTPLERVTALVHNSVHRERTGKDMLSDSERYTLTNGWKGSMGEVRTYNRYINIASLEGSMRMDARLFAYHSELAVVRNQRLLSYYLSDMKRSAKISAEMAQGLTQKEFIRYATEHTYLDYRDVLHTFTFDRLPPDIRDDLILLDDSAPWSKQYLEDEVLLYEMLKGGKLNSKDKETLVNTIFSRMYHDGIRKMRKGTEQDGFMVGGFFAELPLKEVVVRVAHDASIKWKGRDEEELLESIEKCAKEKDVTMESLVREALHAWLDVGLFTKEFAPIFANTRRDTWNGNTKKSHKELFAVWYEELETSKKYLASLCRARKLRRQEIEMTMLGETRTVETITGESLYACTEDLRLVREYKRQVELLLPFSNLARFIEKHANPVRNHATLREFRKMADRAGCVFDVDFTHDYDDLIDSYKDEVMLLNHEMTKLTDTATEHLFGSGKERFRYEIHILDGKLGFNLEDDGDTADIAQKYAEEFKKLSV